MRKPCGLLCFTLLLILQACGPGDQSSRVRPLLDRYVGYWNSGNFQGIESVVDGRFQFRMSPTFEPTIGINSLKEEISKTRATFAAFHITIEEVVGNERALAARWTITARQAGKHSSQWRPVTFRGISLFHIENGKLMDEWVAQ